MSSISTYVFLDIETTGLPSEDNNRTKVTEISMVAVKKAHLLDTRVGESPRVQQRMTLCMNPGRIISPVSTDITGLCNDLLEFEPYFNINVFKTIVHFLGLFTKPVCLIAENGLAFDFPIIKAQIVKLKEQLPDDILVADSLHAFYDILEARKATALKQLQETPLEAPQEVTKDDHSTKESTACELEEQQAMKLSNESTPMGQKIRTNKETLAHKVDHKMKVKKVKRKLFFGNNKKPTESYKLKNVYERVLNRPSLDAHRAEQDCLMTLEVAVALGKEFIAWVEENNIPFSEIKPMTPGEPMGK